MLYIFGAQEQRMTGEIDTLPKRLQGVGRAGWFFDLDGWGEASLASRCRTCQTNPGPSSARRTHPAAELGAAHHGTVYCVPIPCLSCCASTYSVPRWATSTTPSFVFSHHIHNIHHIHHFVLLPPGHPMQPTSGLHACVRTPMAHYGTPRVD